MAHEIKGSATTKYWVAFNADKTVKYKGICNTKTIFRTGLSNMEVFDTKVDWEARSLELGIKDREIKLTK